MTDTERQHDVLTADRAKLTLRVLSGPNIGAETRLGEGTWLIGSHDSDDLTFGDPELLGSHVRIAIAAGTLEVTAHAPGVFIGNRQCPTDSPRILAPFTPVRIGRTIFSLGPVGQNFPDVNSLGEYEEVDANHVSSAPADSSTPDGRRTRLAKGSIRPLLRVGAVISGVLIAVYASWVGIGRLRSSRLATILSRYPITIATDISPARLGPNVNVTRPDDKVASHLGPRETAQVQGSGPGGAAEAAPQRPNVTTLSHAKLIDLATTVLRAFDIEGSIRVEDAGQIVVTGYSRSDAMVKAALYRLQQDIPGVHKVDDEVITPDRSRAFLEAAASIELRRSIRIVAKPDVVSVSGVLTATTYSDWQNVASRFEQRFKPYIRLESHCELMMLPATRGVHLGRVPFIVLQNGTRVKVGDNIDRFGKITAIDGEGVFVQVATSNLRVPYSSKPEWITEEDQR
ncbi:FHA domain-containing protein [Bradyrhizobium genosp. P]|uniref:FHA domain-containing protein n=1 Tax=Bradyrhizobium genosp. P TaxID=83641 RepID=UPI003CF8AE9D